MCRWSSSQAIAPTSSIARSNFPPRDLSTVEQRWAACEAELALNPRMAPKLYLDVRALTRAMYGGGRLWG